ncbi:hypothetical protein TNCV_3208301 [Trichonephila clavipes]|nr:hypothetical protein TNCV_3208301 [Trichonephila clavipes]
MVDNDESSAVTADLTVNLSSRSAMALGLSSHQGLEPTTQHCAKACHNDYLATADSTSRSDIYFDNADYISTFQ